MHANTEITSSFNNIFVYVYTVTNQKIVKT